MSRPNASPPDGGRPAWLDDFDVVGVRAGELVGHPLDFLVICRQQLVSPTAVIRHEPGTHPHAPIYDHLVAVEIVTPVGSRWYGEDTNTVMYRERAR